VDRRLLALGECFVEARARHEGAMAGRWPDVPARLYYSVTNL
jgi:hypothetical protein